MKTLLTVLLIYLAGCSQNQSASDVQVRQSEQRDQSSLAVSKEPAPSANVRRGFEEAANRAAEHERRIDEQVPSREELRQIVDKLGTPVAFDDVFKAVQSLPRFKDEFETTKEFENRQALAAAKLPQFFLIYQTINLDDVKYDADNQVMVVSVFDFNNGEPGRARANKGHKSDISAVLGFGSELHQAGIEIDYGLPGLVSNVAWQFDDTLTSIGTYTASNAFGKETVVLKEKQVARGVFERRGRGWSENVWQKNMDYGDPVHKIAFSFELTPDEARKLKNRGMYAGILVSPQPPYFSTATTQFNPTLKAPYDCKTQINYLIANIKGVAVFDSDDSVLDIRPTR